MGTGVRAGGARAGRVRRLLNDHHERHRARAEHPRARDAAAVGVAAPHTAPHGDDRRRIPHDSPAARSSCGGRTRGREDRGASGRDPGRRVWPASSTTRPPCVMVSSVLYRDGRNRAGSRRGRRRLSPTRRDAPRRRLPPPECRARSMSGSIGPRTRHSSPAAATNTASLARATASSGPGRLPACVRCSPAGLRHSTHSTIHGVAAVAYGEGAARSRARPTIRRPTIEPPPSSLFTPEQGLTPDRLRRHQPPPGGPAATDVRGARLAFSSRTSSRWPKTAAAGFSPSVLPRPALAHLLRERGVHVDARGEILRLGPAPYLRDDQLRDAIRGLGEALRRLSTRTG